uniref:hypothetical protein n=1 Tax=uncultured Draconibacterium sp. TaxID=1573823 RepID=UPI0032170384
MDTLHQFIQKGSSDLLLLFSDFDGDICSVAVLNQTDKTTHYQSGGYPNKTTSLNFEIKDAGQKLELSNGQVSTRQ